ncbi:translation initiation factor IF-3, mitochondrial [Neodiprion pinetum]|uniref:translation initiation factor IF-3, mitochondrial n=1 Tax=Neodiprion pinetum TaxID=441929 RepID=UPI001EE0E3B1|nr:translation initiation factor IF-3, mitochondrial [Neodiprion pinetum]
MSSLRNVMRRLGIVKLIRKGCVSQVVCGTKVPRLSERSPNRFLYTTVTRGTSTDGLNLTEKPKSDDQAAPGKSKMTQNVMVTVISPDLTPSVMTLDEAHRISKRRELKLVKVMDAAGKTKRPIYKLMTGTEYFAEELNRRKQKSARPNGPVKEPKIAGITAKIADHDLDSKMRNFVKWLNKRHEVRVTITADGNLQAAEKIYEVIVAGTNHAGKAVQKRVKEGTVKFQLVPLKVMKQDSQVDSDETPIEESEDGTTKRSEST